ncbi:hypothetical protein [Halorubrum salsamenti]|uniref:hypothetical protein n=1 Tax=Halorubrum salsamenti TaxID=2583990 RepID=UPI0011A59EB0|nr:hypothetical protein [Halorubrum salsamenti]
MDTRRARSDLTVSRGPPRASLRGDRSAPPDRTALSAAVVAGTAAVILGERHFRIRLVATSLPSAAE